MKHRIVQCLAGALISAVLVISNGGVSFADGPTRAAVSISWFDCSHPHRLAVSSVGDYRGIYGCLLTSGGVPFDGPATFESTGVGYITNCQDPDGDGPKTAVSRDRNNDGRVDYCHLSGVSDIGVHTTGVSDLFGRPGIQRLIFCFDPGNVGCRASRVQSQGVIRWVSP